MWQILIRHHENEVFKTNRIISNETDSVVTLAIECSKWM